MNGIMHGSDAVTMVSYVYFLMGIPGAIPPHRSHASRKYRDIDCETHKKRVILLRIFAGPLASRADSFSLIACRTYHTCQAQRGEARFRHLRREFIPLKLKYFPHCLRYQFVALFAHVMFLSLFLLDRQQTSP